MTRQPNQSDLGTIEAVENEVAGIRKALNAIAGLDGVNAALTIVEQLEDSIADIAADIEFELNERTCTRTRKEDAEDAQGAS